MTEFTPGAEAWRPAAPAPATPATPGASAAPVAGGTQGAPAAPSYAHPAAAPGAAPAQAGIPAAAPAQPTASAQPVAPGQPHRQPLGAVPAAQSPMPSLHGTAAPARASFLEERRAAAPATPPAGAAMPARPAAPAAQAAPVAQPAATPTPASSAASQMPVDPAQAFAMAAAQQLPPQQRSFAPAPEPAPQPKAAPAPAAKPAVQVKPQGGQRLGMSIDRQDSDLDINQALRAQIKLGASDLHLTSGVPPMVRLDGGLQPLEGFAQLTPESLQRSLYGILTQAQREHFEEELELDFSYSVVGEARFRVNLYRQRDSLGAAFRVIPYEIKPLESLGIPEVVGNFAQLPRGLVLVTGPTGSGKSTTLASLVDLANRSRSAHIMTVEDPIEFLHKHKRSIVNQREVGADTRSFGKALKHVLRQDPDIILIGEMRDIETISVALTAAETGHLVFATLHTQSAPQTMDRIIDVFPPEQQGQVRTQLAAAIQGVLCQTLLKRADRPGRAVAVEIMVATPGIRNLIREGKTHQIFTSMQGGASQGMQTMDSHLAELVKSGQVAYEVAVEMAQSYDEFNRLCGRHGR